MSQSFSKCIYCHDEFSDAKVVDAKRSKITEYILVGKMPPGDILSSNQKNILLAEVNKIKPKKNLKHKGKNNGRK